MRKTKTLALALLIAILALAALNAKAVTVADPESPTGYRTTISYYDPDATSVRISGGFQFYKKGDMGAFANGFMLPSWDKQANHLVSYTDWKAGEDLMHVNDQGSTVYLEKGEDGLWSAELCLPGGRYMYQVGISYDGGKTYSTGYDKENAPWALEIGAKQNRSQFFVPYCEKQGNKENYDWTFVTPIEDESLRGTIISVYYLGLGGEQNAEIYLPAGYDESREEPYKVLYISHGGAGDVGDWFYQGGLGNITDRMIADGSVEPFVIVCMDNAIYGDVFPTSIYGYRHSDNNLYFLTCWENIKTCLIPYVEKNYNVCTEASGKAFAGLSNGAKQTTFVMLTDPEDFGYYGLFSGSAAWAWPDSVDKADYEHAKVYLAAGFADQLLVQNTYHTSGDKTLVGIKEKLDAAGIPYNNGDGYTVVEGAHDWFTWPLIILDYFPNYLWK